MNETDLIAALDRHTQAVERLVEINQQLLDALIADSETDDEEQGPTYMDGSPIHAR